MNNRGIALLMGLVLLAALSLLALMATSGMLLQQRMSANYGERSVALAHATRAAAAALSWLYSRTDFEREADCVMDCQLPFAIHAPGRLPRNPEFESAAWWQSNAQAAGVHPLSGEPLAAPEPDPPRWVMEEIGYLPLDASAAGPSAAGIAYYRVLARGHGASPGSIAVTESIVARPWQGEFEPLPYPPDSPRAGFCLQFSGELPCGTQAWRQRR